MGHGGSRGRRLLAVAAAVAATFGVVAHDVVPAGAVGPEISIGDASIVEGDAGKRIIRLMVNIDAVAATAVTVDYTTVADSATAGADFKGRSGRVRFNPGQTTRFVKLNVFPDASLEGDESFDVQLSTPVGGTIADATGEATIVDDELALGVQASIGDATVVEGHDGSSRYVFLAVALNEAPTTTASVTFTTAAGSATSPADYLDRTATLTFPPKARVRYALVYLTPDTTAEVTQSFTVSLSAPSGLTIGDGTGTVTLLDDD